MRAPDFWHGHGSGGALACALSPIGRMYGAITSWRATFKPAWHAPVPVICIGNVVLGGAGKTIVGLDLVKRLQKKGQTPHVILRGYGGRKTEPTRVEPDRHTADDVGDEALLFAALSPTWVGRNRADVAKHAVDAGASVIIMDDGFQNPSLYKDVSLLVIDGEYGFGNGHVFPAGPLREPAHCALKRAHAVITLGGTTQMQHDLPAFDARVIPDAGAPDLKGQRVVAFAGIGRPEKFFHTLASCGAEIINTHSFDDHHPFQAFDIERIISEAEKNACRAMTTDKDYARIPANLRSKVTPFPVQLDWDDANAFESFLLNRLGLS